MGKKRALRMIRYMGGALGAAAVFFLMPSVDAHAMVSTQTEVGDPQTITYDLDDWLRGDSRL